MIDNDAVFDEEDGVELMESPGWKVFGDLRFWRGRVLTGESCQQGGKQRMSRDCDDRAVKGVNRPWRPE